jgi:hypothetical protein
MVAFIEIVIYQYNFILSFWDFQSILDICINIWLFIEWKTKYFFEIIVAKVIHSFFLYLSKLFLLYDT